MSKKLLRALGLESETPPVVPEEGLQPTETPPTDPAPADPVDPVDPTPVEPTEDDSFESADEEAGELVQEGDELNDASEEVTQTIVTLEAIDTILAGAPEDQINETTAQIVDAAMQDIAGRFDIEKAPELSVESFRTAGIKKYREIAREDVDGKLAAFKNGLNNIVKKIVELCQKFWQWLTMNHKRVKAALEEAVKAVDGAEEQATLTMESRFRTLMTTGEFDPAKTVSLAGYMGELCVSAQIFITSGFTELSEKSSDSQMSFGNGESMSRRVKAGFKGCKEEGGKILLYVGIGGRDLTIIPATRGAVGFTTELTKCEDDFASPESISLKKEDAVRILRASGDLIATSEKDFDKINRMQKKMSALAIAHNMAGGNISPSPKLMQLTHALNAYNRALVAFIDGIFTQSLRFGNAAASLGKAYGKKASKAPEPGHEGNTDAHNPDALRLA